MRSRSQMDNKSLAMQFELVRLRKERDDLKIKVELLREGRVEKDMLDQQARHLLNMVKADEFVIITE